MKTQARLAPWLLLLYSMPGLAANPTQPYVVTTIPPEYPEEARKNNIEGHVTVTLDIDTKGRVTNVTVNDSEPPGIFDQAAVEAVLQWRAIPSCAPTFDAPFKAQQVVHFSLRNDMRLSVNLQPPVRMNNVPSVAIASDGSLVATDPCAR